MHGAAYSPGEAAPTNCTAPPPPGPERQTSLSQGPGPRHPGEAAGGRRSQPGSRKPPWLWGDQGALGRAGALPRPWGVSAGQGGTQAPEAPSQLGWPPGAQPQVATPTPIAGETLQSLTCKVLGNLTKHPKHRLLSPQRGAGRGGRKTPAPPAPRPLPDPEGPPPPTPTKAQPRLSPRC